MMDVIQDLHVSGNKKAAGGVFKKIHVSGMCTMTDLVTSVNICISGIAKFQKIKTEDLHVSGMLTANDDVLATKTHISGKVTIKKELKSDDLKISGMLDCESLKAEQIHVSGYLRVNDVIEAEHLNVSGRLKNKNLMTLGTLNLEASEGSQLHDIEAEQITIKRDKSSIFKSNLNIINIFSKKKNDVIANNLEADKIEIEDVSARLVRGGHVVIGPNCEVDCVQYHHTVSIDESAKVKSVNQI